MRKNAIFLILLSNWILFNVIHGDEHDKNIMKLARIKKLATLAALILR